MRTLDQITEEILGYYYETELSIEDAVAKSAPWDDFDEDTTQQLLGIGLRRHVTHQVHNGRTNGEDEERARRSYMGKLQHRPGATSKEAYLEALNGLWKTFDVGGFHLPIVLFELSHVDVVRQDAEDQIAGWQNRREFWVWLKSEMVRKKKSRVADLPQSSLDEANKRVGEAWK